MNVAVPGYCPPGWRKFEESCFQVHLLRKKPWGNARFDCWNRGGRLAVFEYGFDSHKITEFLDDYIDERTRFSVGAFAASEGRWITVKNEPFSFDKYSSLWGPYEPSGDGRCGDLIWIASWKGKGWRINDGSCLRKKAFICQRQKRNLSMDVLIAYLDRGLVTEIVSSFPRNLFFLRRFHNHCNDCEKKKRAVDRDKFRATFFRDSVLL